MIFKNSGQQNDFVLEGEQCGSDNMSKWRVIITVLCVICFNTANKLLVEKAESSSRFRAFVPTCW